MTTDKRIALTDSEEFVKVTDGEMIYYGGDQEWYQWNDKQKTMVARQGGCAAVAAANITAYLAKHHSDCAQLYRYPNHTKEHYIQHMKDMYEYITPRHIGGISFGVWPVSMMQKGVEAFAADRGVNLWGVWSSGSFDREHVTEYIKNALQKNLPVAMLVGANILPDIRITRSNQSGWRQNISMHWMTATELYVDENEKIMIKASTWGGWAAFDLERYLDECIYAGMIYFELYK